MSMTHTPLTSSLCLWHHHHATVGHSHPSGIITVLLEWHLCLWHHHRATVGHSHPSGIITVLFGVTPVPLTWLLGLNCSWGRGSLRQVNVPDLRSVKAFITERSGCMFCSCLSKCRQTEDPFIGCSPSADQTLEYALNMTDQGFYHVWQISFLHLHEAERQHHRQLHSQAIITHTDTHTHTHTPHEYHWGHSRNPSFPWTSLSFMPLLLLLWKAITLFFFFCCCCCFPFVSSLIGFCVRLSLLCCDDNSSVFSDGVVWRSCLWTVNQERLLKWMFLLFILDADVQTSCLHGQQLANFLIVVSVSMCLN